MNKNRFGVFAEDGSPVDSPAKSTVGGSTAGGGAGYIICAWCQKTGTKLFTLQTANVTKAFCSEFCFTQCRRASFKKNKVCDWCKHVRHTVNYVDFQVSTEGVGSRSREQRVQGVRVLLHTVQTCQL